MSNEIDNRTCVIFKSIFFQCVIICFVYSICSQFQQSMSESEVKEDDNETEHNSTAAPNPDIKKKRKKRKKRSGKHGGYHRSSEDNADVRMKMCIFNFILFLYPHIFERCA